MNFPADWPRLPLFAGFPFRVAEGKPGNRFCGPDEVEAIESVHPIQEFIT